NYGDGLWRISKTYFSMQNSMKQEPCDFSHGRFSIDMCSMILKQRSLFLSAMIPIAFFANFVMSINVIFILSVCCFVCVMQAFYKKRENK
ncbi:MAG: hypothetical protein E6029_05505, partial [Clostridioides difficile]|nr:hypothetical protein [Clostridioides difficile]MDU2055890.1 hypothetical protein [Clostridioides difficile]MDU2174764.1 hypothetical protein [Clostridioides difficile]MDU2336838.1 hypothetical protein [Clostridioides difficile]MDU2651898.1 hypothetical protein [Clostridioides difficile]